MTSTDRRPDSITELSPSPVVELRQYTLHPGKRDVLIDLFDREFIESQEELGMTVIGQFRDVDDADRFVWLRGFHDMASRAQGLAAFYCGPVWKEHRAVANSTMIDSDNVLLLRPARLGSGFPRSAEPRPPRDSTGNGTGLVLATIYALDAPPDCDVVDDFSRRLTASLVDAGGALQALFVTEPSPNNYPTLPVREHENVFAWFAGFPDAAAGLRWSPDVALEKTWADDPGLTGSPQRMRIIPTVRSGLTGASPGCVAS